MGFAALSVATFFATSYIEVKQKIDRQIAAGEDPYELRVPLKPDKAQQRPKPKRKPRK